MNHKREIRFKKSFYKEPEKPVPGSKKFRVEIVKSVSERYQHFPNSGRDEIYEYDGDDPELTGKLPERQSICLEHINELIKEQGLDPKDVYLTVSFAEDYLCIEAIYVKELNDEDQLMEYKYNIYQWEKQKKAKAEHELKRINQEMEALKRRAEILNKK